MFEAIGDFFKRVGQWISGLFGGEDTPPATPGPEPIIEVDPFEQASEDVAEETNFETNEQDPQATETETAEAEPAVEQETPTMNSTAANDASTDGIIDAYFAKKVIEKVKTDNPGNPYPYQFNYDGNVITDANKPNIAQIILTNSASDLETRNEYIELPDILGVLENTTYDSDDVLQIPTRTLEDQEKFEKIDSSALESDIYIFAKTGNLDGKEITITILEKEELLVGSDAPLPVLLRDHEVEESQASEDLQEVTELVETIDESYVAIPIRLRPSDDEDLEEWKNMMAGELEEEEDSDEGSEEQEPETDTENDVPPPEPVTYTVQNGDILSIIAGNYPGVSWQDIQAANNITNPTQIQPGQILIIPVNGVVPATNAEGNGTEGEEAERQTVFLWLKVAAEGDEESHEEEFLNENDEAYFEIGNKCSCDRGFTVSEMQTIIDTLRDEENATLFTAGNCDIPEVDKTMERFTEVLNEIFETYGITKCIRKIHFLAQVYHESDRLRTTEEYSTTGRYAPYIGRGIMQLTWEVGYKAYSSFTGEDFVTNYEDIRNDLRNALDSAGWYWRQGKQLNASGTTWSPPNGSTYVSRDDLSYTRTIIEYTYEEVAQSYGTVNLSDIADDDEGDLISWLVNGGSNGRQERLDFIDDLKEVFQYPELCVNTGLVIRLVRKWETENSTIGEFTIDNSDVSGYMLEEKGPDTTQSGLEQRVPTGTYDLEWHNGTRFQGVLKLSNIEVSAARAILIHGGNTAGDTEGCLLPGSTRDTDFVGGSQATLSEIHEVVEEKGIDGAQIIITEDYE
tara:strand:- start:82628 stop:85018 length:2391 start_codon:yes stop_codon:yes gene_type:complete